MATIMKDYMYYVSATQLTVEMLSGKADRVEKEGVLEYDESAKLLIIHDIAQGGVGDIVCMPGDYLVLADDKYARLDRQTFEKFFKPVSSDKNMYTCESPELPVNK